MSDRLGRKRVMQIGLAAFGAFSLLAAFSHDVSTLLVARALMGAAAAFVFPATLSTLTIVFDDTRRAGKGLRAVGRGERRRHRNRTGRRGTPARAFLVRIDLSHQRAAGRRGPCRVELRGARVEESSAATSSTSGDCCSARRGCTLLTLATIQGPSWGWLSAVDPGAVCARAFVAVICFVRYELRRVGPLSTCASLPTARSPPARAPLPSTTSSLFGFIFLITQYFQLVRGYSPLSAGVHTLPFAGGRDGDDTTRRGDGPAMGCALGGRGRARHRRAALAWGGVVSADAAYVGPIVAIMILLAFGFSLVNAPSTASLMGTLRPDQVGAGAAVNETTRELAGALGVAVVGSVFSSFFGPGVRAALGRYVGHGLTASQLRVATSSTPAAQATVAHFPSIFRPALNADVTNAFMSGLHHGCLVASGSCSGWGDPRVLEDAEPSPDGRRGTGPRLRRLTTRAERSDLGVASKKHRRAD